MLKKIAEYYYLDGNFNCAETILHAANDFYQLNIHEHDMRLVSGFGGGIQTGHACGAILAAVSVLSMKYVENKAHESTEIKEITADMVRDFENIYGSLMCKDIRSQAYTEEHRCRNALLTACDVLEEVIKKYDTGRLN